MHVRTGYGETLPALLRRRHGVPERATLLAAGVVVALVVAGYLILHDPLQGRTQRVHRAAPVFNTLYPAGVVHPAPTRGDELEHYQARRGALRLSFTVTPLRLPPYRGDVAGLLPVYMERHMAALAARLPGFTVTDEGKARVHGSPGYQVGFRYGAGGRRSSGRDVIVVPLDQPGTRDGVVLAYRQTRGRRRPGAAGQALIAAMRSTFRSFMFGSDRNT